MGLWRGHLVAVGSSSGSSISSWMLNTALEARLLNRALESDTWDDGASNAARWLTNSIAVLRYKFSFLSL